MDATQNDKNIIKELIKKKAEIAALPVHAEKIKLWTQTNDVKPGRPVVLIWQEPWGEYIDGYTDELECRCEDPFLKGIENELRREIFKWTRYPADMIVSPVLCCPMAIDKGRMGMRVNQKLIKSATGSQVQSHGFTRVLNDMEDVEKLVMPEVSHDTKETNRRFELLTEIADGILPVQKTGIGHQWFILWDMLIRYFGVEQAMMDLVMNPALIHASLDRLLKTWQHRLKQYEDLNLLSPDWHNGIVGSGGYAYTDELPSSGYNPEKITTSDQWGCGNAQIFTSVSPEMHNEFSLDYEKKWLENFGLVYYGCCERLDIKMDMLDTIPNLRKISASPWTDVAVMAERSKGKYVLSIKANPAILAESTWRVDQAEKELRKTLDAADECNVEVILKDISTTNKDVTRIEEWSAMAMNVVQEYAN
jgi:hypothetical protein